MKSFVTTLLLSIMMMILFGNVTTAQIWTPQTISPTARVFSIKAISENVVWAGADSGRYLRTTNGGATWITGFIPNASSLIMNSIAPINRDTAYFEGTNPSGGDARIFKTTNGGGTWTQQYQNTNASAWFNSIAFWDSDNGIAESDPVNGSFLIVTTTNGGVTWNQTPAANIPAPLGGEFGGFGDGGGTVLAVQGTNNAWFGTAYGPGTSRITRVLRSTNKGQNWTVANVPFVDAGAYFGATSIIFRDALNGFVAGQSDGGRCLAKTTDGGLSWSLVSSFDSSIVSVGTLAFVPGTNNNSIVAATVVGTMNSLNGGTMWSLLSSDLIIAMSFASPTVGWGANRNAGELFEYTGSPLVTVEQQKNEGVPGAFSLHQNYPNPFNPSTVIRYSLPVTGYVTLKVFNVLGQEVATLANEELKPGTYSVEWNASSFASGVYFYQTAAKGFVDTKKLILVR